MSTFFFDNALVEKSAPLNGRVGGIKHNHFRFLQVPHQINTSALKLGDSRK